MASHPESYEMPGRGPFVADQIRNKDPYELSNGHPIQWLPTGSRGSRSSLSAGEVLDSDPAVQSAGMDTGYSPEPGTLRAPDVAVGNVPDAPGWVKGTPPLAVEYADVGQDEPGLQKKIAELLAAGTRYLWVVRMSGPRRVEVYEPGGTVRTYVPGDELRAPGVLQNPVPVLALFDRDAAHEVTLRNLLQRRGYQSLDAVQTAGRLDGLRDALKRLLTRRGLLLTAEHHERIDTCSDVTALQAWIDEAAVASDAAQVFGRNT